MVKEAELFWSPEASVPGCGCPLSVVAMAIVVPPVTAATPALGGGRPTAYCSVPPAIVAEAAQPPASYAKVTRRVPEPLRMPVKALGKTAFSYRNWFVVPSCQVSTDRLADASYAGVTSRLSLSVSDDSLPSVLASPPAGSGQRVGE